MITSSFWCLINIWCNWRLTSKLTVTVGKLLYADQCRGKDGRYCTYHLSVKCSWDLEWMPLPACALPRQNSTNHLAFTSHFSSVQLSSAQPQTTTVPVANGHGRHINIRLGCGWCRSDPAKIGNRGRPHACDTAYCLFLYRLSNYGLIDTNIRKL